MNVVMICYIFENKNTKQEKETGYAKKLGVLKYKTLQDTKDETNANKPFNHSFTVIYIN